MVKPHGHLNYIWLKHFVILYPFYLFMEQYVYNSNYLATFLLSFFLFILQVYWVHEILNVCMRVIKLSLSFFQHYLVLLYIYPTLPSQEGCDKRCSKNNVWWSNKLINELMKLNSNQSKCDPRSSVHFCYRLTRLLRISTIKLFLKLFLKSVSISPLEPDIFIISMCPDTSNNNFRWIWDRKNMMDLAKSHIPTQWIAAETSLQHVAEHYHPSKMWPSIIIKPSYNLQNQFSKRSDGKLTEQ